MHILLADDHELVRDTIIAFIQKDTGFQVDGVADLPQALRSVETQGPYDLVLLDYDMPGMFGLQGLSRMLNHKGAAAVAILSGTMPHVLVEQAFELGASGYLPKTLSPPSLIAAIRLILGGSKFAPSELVRSLASETTVSALPSLSPRESTVLRHLCCGMTNIEIAQALSLHEATVKIHIKSICDKMSARNRTHASVIAREAGFY